MLCRLHKHQVIDLFVLEALPISLDCLIKNEFKNIDCVPNSHITYSMGLHF